MWVAEPVARWSLNSIAGYSRFLGRMLCPGSSLVPIGSRKVSGARGNSPDGHAECYAIVGYNRSYIGAANSTSRANAQPPWPATICLAIDTLTPWTEAAFVMVGTSQLDKVQKKNCAASALR